MQLDLLRKRQFLACQAVSRTALQACPRQPDIPLRCNVAARRSAGSCTALGLECPSLLCRTSSHVLRSEEHTSELQSLMRISYAVFCLKKKKTKHEPYEHTLQIY